MITVYLVRHGETFLNQLNRMQGWINSELSQKGVRQALTVGQILAPLSFDGVFCSDLPRAIQTRNLILSQLTTPIQYQITTPNLREVNFGSFDGLPSSEVWSTITSSTSFIDQEDIILHEGMSKVRSLMNKADPRKLAETYSSVIKRWQSTESLIHSTFNNRDAKILIVSHGTFIRTISEYYGANIYQNFPSNAGITVLQMNNRHTQLVKYNQSLYSEEP